VNLYVVANGYMGESYVRVYVWAQDEAQAIDLARKSFERDAIIYKKSDDARWDSSRFRVRYLFTADALPFATMPSDTGFATWERGSYEDEP